MFEFTPVQLKAVIPNNRDVTKLRVSLMKFLPKYEINTKERIALFLGQGAVESQEFNVMTENLNYSEVGLIKTFGPRVAPVAKRIANKPEMIANFVYANRLGNGDPASGDGWKYRGQGFIQLTGKDNITAFAKGIGMSVEQALLYLKTLDGASESACWYWSVNKINDFADRLDIEGATFRINRKGLAMAERIKYTRKALAAFSTDASPATPPATLKKGDSGIFVFQLQEKLTKHGFAVTIDGDFGEGTKNAVKQFQKANNLPDDGVVGQKTRELL